jgi:hypothetical protein
MGPAGDIYASWVGVTGESHHAWLVWDEVLLIFLPGAGLNTPIPSTPPHPPNLYLLNSWNYKHELPCPTSFFLSFFPPALFCVGYFWERVSPSICLGWPQTAILLISASWVVRITGWHPALWSIFIFPFMVLFGVYLDYDKLGDRLISLGHQLLGRQTIYQYKHTDIKVY